jgi:hypothetical protein
MKARTLSLAAACTCSGEAEGWAVSIALAVLA